jgi:hypothetical protein
MNDFKNNLKMNNRKVITDNEKRLFIKIRTLIILFIFCLVLSGITAFPIETELAFLVNHPGLYPDFVGSWVREVYAAVHTTNTNFPFLSYGTDWLAFAHIAIAVAFIGPLKDPIRNIWVVKFGMIACLMVFALAFICGPIRGIPFYWRLIDCSFGFFGLIPLIWGYYLIKKLEKIRE